MVYGIERRRISEKYSNITTSEFGQSSFQTSLDSLGWYPFEGSHSYTLTATNGFIKIVNSDAVTKLFMLHSGYVPMPLSEDPKQETMLRAIFAGFSSNSSIGFGVAAGLDYIGSKWVPTCAVSVTGGYFRMSISDDGTGSQYNWFHNNGTNSTRVVSETVTNYTSTRNNAFEIRLLFSKGGSDGTDLVSIRGFLLINKNIIAKFDKEVDAVNDVYRDFSLDVRPFVQVMNGGSYDLHIEQAGVYV